MRLPVLWLFTDASRMPDPLPVVARLPAGLCGVVFRHDEVMDRAVLAARVAVVCRARRLALVVAGDARLAARVGAGVHLRGGRWPGLSRVKKRLVTASAHDAPDIFRARQAGATILFISPVFATASHPQNPGLGPVRWRVLAGQARPAFAYALGGISGRKINSLAGFCYGAGAIHAFGDGISS